MQKRRYAILLPGQYNDGRNSMHSGNEPTADVETGPHSGVIGQVLCQQAAKFCAGAMQQYTLIAFR